MRYRFEIFCGEKSKIEQKTRFFQFFLCIFLWNLRKRMFCQPFFLLYIHAMAAPERLCHTLKMAPGTVARG